MSEREPRKEDVGRGALHYLWNPETESIFSGYGLTVYPDRPDRLVGLLMVDRPQHANPRWLKSVTDTYGECQLYPMTATGERGLACRMRIESDSIPHLRRFSSGQSDSLRQALLPLLEHPPAPTLSLGWDQEKQYWVSKFAAPNELLPEVRQVFENSGYGSLAVESSVGVVHICHAPDADIEGFRGKPASYHWELIEMPTAPLVRLAVRIFDTPTNPFLFESFLNVGEQDQLGVLTQLASQENLHFAFYGDDLEYRFAKNLEHDEQQWQKLDEIITRALAYWEQLPPTQKDFDFAKAAYLHWPI